MSSMTIVGTNVISEAMKFEPRIRQADCHG